MTYRGYFIEYMPHLDSYRITKLGNPYDTVAILDGEDYPTFNHVKADIDFHLNERETVDEWLPVVKHSGLNAIRMNNTWTYLPDDLEKAQRHGYSLKKQNGQWYAGIVNVKI